MVAGPPHKMGYLDGSATKYLLPEGHKLAGPPNNASVCLRKTPVHKEICNSFKRRMRPPLNKISHHTIAVTRRPQASWASE